MIFYCLGWSPGEHSVAATLVYVPDADGDRTDADGRPYSKCVFAGTLAESKRLSANVSPAQFDALRSMQVAEETTRLQYFSVDRATIDEVFDPRAPVTLSSSRASATERRLVEAVGVFLERGVDLNNIGVYGGLQCGMTGSRGERDVDLLVWGARHYDTVVEVSDGHPVDVSTSVLRTTQHPEELDVVRRRASLSRFPLTDGTDVDVRILRLENDDLHHDTMATYTKEIYLEEAVILNSSEGLSLPCAYEVAAGNVRTWVSSVYYHHVGAAHRGDLVSIKGFCTTAGEIHLTDPDKHFIALRGGGRPR